MDPFSYLCFVFVFVIPCSIVITCWERAYLMALLCVMFSYVFVTFPYAGPGRVWYLIVLIAYFCLFLTLVLYVGPNI